MNRPLPPMQWLRSFEAVARHLSFTQAAAELGITQSAVSQHMQALESWYRYPLFQRYGRGILLTNEANQILPNIREAIGLLETALGISETHLAKDPLIVSVSGSLLYSVIASNISDFLSKHEGDVRFHSNIWRDGPNPVRADVDIRFSDASIVSSGFEALGVDRIRLITGVNMPPFHEDRMGEIILIETIGSNDRLSDILVKAGLKTAPKRIVQVDNYGTALAMVEAGQGAALCSQVVAMPSIQAGKVQVVDGYEFAAKSSYYGRIENSQKRAATEFLDWLKSRLKAIM